MAACSFQQISIASPNLTGYRMDTLHKHAFRFRKPLISRLWESYDLASLDKPLWALDLFLCLHVGNDCQT